MGALRGVLAGAVVATTLAVTAGSASAANEELWRPLPGGPSAAARRGAQPEVAPERFSAYALDRDGMANELAAASLVLSLPTPVGGFQRFAISESPVMEPELARQHPDITTFRGRGVDQRGATVRLDLTPLGFHASVRGPQGSWYIDPYNRRDQSAYVSYFGRDLTEDPHGTFVEREDEHPLDSLAPEAVGGPTTGPQLRTYRLALLSNPNYATYFGGPDKVTAAKVALINRVTQIYEDDSSIRLVLIGENDALNLDTNAEMIDPNGPCGSAACFTAAQSASCSGSTLNRNRIVIGQLVGAGAYDIGHIILGNPGGGVAGLGVVGGDGKARGCTGLSAPTGDFFAVDYVAHEMGHQFAGNHTFNGTLANCSGGNRNGANSVEPGSGSSIMAYAGICGNDDLQPHSDPYWSQRSFQEIATFVTSSRLAINEVQTVSLRDFDTDGDAFHLRYAAGVTAPIVRGTSYTAADIKAAIEASTPAGTTVTVAPFGGGIGALTDAGFQVTFGGALAATNVEQLSVAEPTGTAGFVGETAKGGAVDNQGHEVTPTGNAAPTASAPDALTIPYRTPFALTGSATDSDGDAVTYLWEQNDRGGSSGTALQSNVKTDGPLFRQFGVPLQQPPYDPTQYESPGENHPTTDPERVLPDMAQILANDTNAKTGTCDALHVHCFSEFLPAAGYTGPMHFRMTARDGHGGVASADTTVSLAPGTGPFLVTSQSAGDSLNAGTTQTVTWDVAGTDAAPVDAEDVKITLSTASFERTLAASTPNDGSEEITLPNVSTEAARIKVEALGNVFFDVSDADFPINAAPVVTDSGDAAVQYSDALAPPLTVTATDADSPGTALKATASGLPAGLALEVASTSGGTRTWRIAGNVTAAPGSYDVTVTVLDDASAAGTTTFTIRVTAEDAEAAYAGDELASPGTVLLRATVREAADGAPGDIRTATVTFKEGATTLCGPVPVNGESGHCSASLPTGTHAVTVHVGGRYVGSTSGAVKVAPAGGRSLVAAGLRAAGATGGAFAADPGSRLTFALTARRSLSTARIGFRSGGKSYEIDGTGLQSLGFDGDRADVRTGATLYDGHRVVARDLTLRVTATDGPDSLGVTLWNGDTLLLASEWTGLRTVERRLDAGTVLIL